MGTQTAPASPAGATALAALYAIAGDCSRAATDALTLSGNPHLRKRHRRELRAIAGDLTTHAAALARIGMIVEPDPGDAPGGASPRRKKGRKKLRKSDLDGARAAD